MSKRSNRRSAVFLLVLMVLGGLACPCRGIPATVDHSCESTEECSHSCCEGCRKEGPTQEPVKTPCDCCCLSGCCAPYVLPTQGNTLQGVSTLTVVWAPVSLADDCLHTIAPMLACWFPDIGVTICPGTRLPGLSTLLI